MSHWSEKYVGMAYEPGVFDCGVLVERVQYEVFGREIIAPSDRDYLGAKCVTEKFNAMSDQVLRLKERYAEPTTVPADGDAVLMTARGYSCHLGIFCSIAGEKWVLHCSDVHHQVVMHRIRELELRGMAVEGYYKWK